MLLFYCFLVAIPLPCITQVTAEINKQLDQNEYNQTCAKKNGSSAIYVVKIHSSRQSKQPQSNTYRRETFRMQYMRHSSNLKTHNRMHKGEKLFKCDECGKQFSLRCNLNDHIRTHSNEKLLECDICGKNSNNAATMSNKRFGFTVCAQYSSTIPYSIPNTGDIWSPRRQLTPNKYAILFAVLCSIKDDMTE
ncbi:hypothetical protein DINM_000855 [Dirofilaria immitis]|nr:hypothetical protein [Dirofilaria immitis]